MTQVAQSIVTVSAAASAVNRSVPSWPASSCDRPNWSWAIADVLLGSRSPPTSGTSLPKGCDRVSARSLAAGPAGRGPSGLSPAGRPRRATLDRSPSTTRRKQRACVALPTRVRPPPIRCRFGGRRPHPTPPPDPGQADLPAWARARAHADGVLDGARWHGPPRHRTRRVLPGARARERRQVHHRRAGVGVPGDGSARPVPRRHRVRTPPALRREQVVEALPVVVPRPAGLRRGAGGRDRGRDHGDRRAGLCPGDLDPAASGRHRGAGGGRAPLTETPQSRRATTTTDRPAGIDVRDSSRRSSPAAVPSAPPRPPPWRSRSLDDRPRSTIDFITAGGTRKL